METSGTLKMRAQTPGLPPHNKDFMLYLKNEIVSIFYRQLNKDYRDMCREVCSYTKNKQVVPSHVQDRYSIVLAKLRNYLDKNSMELPKRKYYYCDDNIETHKYIRVPTVSGTSTRDMENPKFKYS